MVEQAVEQLLLPLKVDQTARFNNYYSHNDFVVESLKKTVLNKADFFVLLRGAKNTGKTHLLQALLAFLRDAANSVQYFYADMLLDAAPDIISFPSQGIVLIDDIHLLAGNSLWERKLYDLYNEAQRQQGVLVCSCEQGGTELFTLKDWVSRLHSGMQLNLPEYNEKQLKAIVKFRAQCLGLHVADGVLDYLLTHYSRDLEAQMQIIMRLDKLSLQSNRRVTIPFIKTCELGVKG